MARYRIKTAHNAAQCNIRKAKETMSNVKTLEESKIYCDECEYLENKPIYAETFLDSGIFEQTGTRFYCRKKDKWYPINSTINQVGFCNCLEGKKAN